jgi:hypothetical protein
MLSAAAELRRTLRRIELVAPEARGMLREARAALRQSRRLLSRGANAGRQVEAVVLQACEVAGEALERLGRMREAAGRLLTLRTRNGAGAEPRAHHRRGRNGRVGG